MPYKDIEDLPDRVRDNLPKHAQEIYLAAFNSAFDEYKSPKDREGDASREETSHKVAWAAVKQKYEKGDDDKWHPKKD
ncbi:MAG TPA: putative cation transport regulator ChaB [Lentimicrobium sp.]|nr:putative cation transport regulator ChaB [Lentimicrobium sp.]